MKRQTAIIFYFLAAYVVLQFAWWGYHIIELTEYTGTESATISKRIVMIIGEGMVFFLILIFGLIKIRSSIKKDLELAERQKNFLLSVTHELKTPVAANKLFWQTILKRELSPEKRSEIAEKALNENERLEQLIDNILNASRIENKSLGKVNEFIDVKSLIEKIADRYKSHKIHLETHLPSESIPILGDEFLLETSLINLIENAFKYGENSLVTISLTKKDSLIEINIADQGPGIPVEFRKRIFEKFYRIEQEETRSQKGTGLGLFITHEFIRLLGGTITCLPNTPKGTIFQIQLKHE